MMSTEASYLPIKANVCSPLSRSASAFSTAISRSGFFCHHCDSRTVISWPGTELFDLGLEQVRKEIIEFPITRSRLARALESRNSGVRRIESRLADFVK